MKRMGMTWAPDWRLLSDVEHSLLNTCRGCSPAPAAHDLAAASGPFAQNATDQEVAISCAPFRPAAMSNAAPR
jgi:hypothetical protein